MTSSSRSSARRLASAGILLAAALAGCGRQDRRDILAEARAAYEARDFVQAAARYGEALAARPGDLDAQVGKALAHLAQGELPEAEAAIAAAQAQAPEAEDVLDIAAQVAFHRKAYDKARLAYGKLAARGGTPQARSRGWAGLGVVAMDNSRMDTARLSFLRALRNDRKNVSAWYHLGLIYRSWGFDSAALEQFRYFVHLNGTFADLRVQKVQRTLIPDLERAVAQAMAEVPGSARRNAAAGGKALAQAKAALAKGDRRAALELYAEALKADPLSYDAALALATEWQKAPAPKGRQKGPLPLPTALKYYQHACKLRPSATSTYLACGRLAMRLGHYATAAEVYSRAMAANPGKLDAVDGLIRALRQAGGRENVARAAEYQSYRDALAPKKAAGAPKKGNA